MSEKSITIFGGPATLILGMPLLTGHLTMSIVGKAGVAWTQVFTYDPASRIMETDDRKLSEAILSYGKGIGPVLGVLMVISDAIIGVVKALASAVRAGPGSLIGIGFFEISFILLLMFISWVLSVYVLYCIAPLFLLSYAIRSIKKARLGDEGEKISNAAKALFLEAVGGIQAPALASQS